jgi:hypothetical protein
MQTAEKQARSPRGKYEPQFRWSEERLATLTEAYALLREPGKEITAMARQIASDHSWPYRPVLYKLYQLRDKQQADESAREAIAPGI